MTQLCLHFQCCLLTDRISTVKLCCKLTTNLLTNSTVASSGFVSNPKHLPAASIIDTSVLICGSAVLTFCYLIGTTHRVPGTSWCKGFRVGSGLRDYGIIIVIWKQNIYLHSCITFIQTLTALTVVLIWLRDCLPVQYLITQLSNHLLHTNEWIREHRRIKSISSRQVAWI